MIIYFGLLMIPMLPILLNSSVKEKLYIISASVKASDLQPTDLTARISISAIPLLIKTVNKPLISD